MIGLKTADRVTTAQLALRVVELEQEVAELWQRIDTLQRIEHQRNMRALDSWVGIFSDDPVFDEAVRYGREWRKRAGRRPEWKGTRQRRAAEQKE